jgi:hypothetical protein
MCAFESHVKDKSPNESRTLQRRKCDLATELMVPWGDRWSCKIVDMSERGFGIVTSVKLRKGDMVNIATPEAKAKVVWMDKNRVGLRVCN